MAGLKPFRSIPKNLVEWGKWFREQTFQEVIDDNIVKGTATFLGISTQIVSVSEDSAGYTVLVEPSIGETFWVTNKETTFFQLNSSNSTSTATVSWVLIR